MLGETSAQKPAPWFRASSDRVTAVAGSASATMNPARPHSTPRRMNSAAPIFSTIEIDTIASTGIVGATRATALNTASGVTPANNARCIDSAITGPSAIGSENGIPSSMMSAPAAGSSLNNRSVVARSGNPAVINGSSAQRPSARALAKAPCTRSMPLDEVSGVGEGFVKDMAISIQREEHENQTARDQSKLARLGQTETKRSQRVNTANRDGLGAAFRLSRIRGLALLARRGSVAVGQSPTCRGNIAFMARNHMKVQMLDRLIEGDRVGALATGLSANRARNLGENHSDLALLDLVHRVDSAAMRAGRQHHPAGKRDRIGVAQQLPALTFEIHRLLRITEGATCFDAHTLNPSGPPSLMYLSAIALVRSTSQMLASVANHATTSANSSSRLA